MGEACANAVDHLLRRFFDGSPALLMLKLMEDRKIDPKVQNQEIASTLPPGST